jgi:hypothetical protein
VTHAGEDIPLTERLPRSVRRRLKLDEIGFTSRDVESRLAGLETGCPVDLVVRAVMPGTVADERRLHERFALLRVRREWFTLTDEIVAAFNP